jgi:hypothetical protein
MDNIRPVNFINALQYEWAIAHNVNLGGFHEGNRPVAPMQQAR